MNYIHQRKRLTMLGALSLITLVLAIPTGATAETGEDSITLASLQGPWALSLVGFTGCGQHSMYVTFTLDAQGQGTATIQSHGQCGNGTTTGVPFVIQTLNSDGSGTANLSCGPGCGWNLIIQVMRSSQVFSVVDVDPVNPGNFIAGTAIRLSRPHSE